MKIKHPIKAVNVFKSNKMPKKKTKKIECKEYNAEICELKGKKIFCRKKKIEVCVEK